MFRVLVEMMDKVVYLGFRVFLEVVYLVSLEFQDFLEYLEFQDLAVIQVLVEQMDYLVFLDSLVFQEVEYQDFRVFLE